jgi:hypothetical protein
MTTLADFDPEAALHYLLAGIKEIVEEATVRHLAALEEVAGELHDLQIAVLTVETNDHRKARTLLREMVALLTERDFTTAVHKEWIRAAQQLVGPVDDPLPTVTDERHTGSGMTDQPLPTIQQDDE